MAHERLRQTIHIALFVFAFFLKFLSRWQAVGLLLLLLCITVAVSPKIKSRIRLHRAHESAYHNGAVLYFLVLICLVLLFPPGVVAATWAVLALGDGAATLIGTHFTARPLPWNDRKTLAGSTAFLLCATVGATVMLLWMVPGMALAAALFTAFKASFVAALVESLPWKINDNISVAVSAALVFSMLL